jgi:hypothetical protein
MNYILDNPIGADRVAQKIQTRLYDNLGWGNIDVYGLTERNFDKEGNPVLEAYVGNNEYRDVLLNDTSNGSIFMIDKNSHFSNDGIRFKTMINVVFMIDLDKIYGTTHRPKREAELAAIKLLRETHIFSFDRMDKGVFDSLGEYYYADLLAFDMHPYYTFSISGEITYSVSCLIDN